MGEEDVHDDRHGEGSGEHAQRRPDQEDAPASGIGVFDFFQTEFGPGMGEIDEKDKSKENEEHGSDESDVLTPYFEEGFGDEEGHNDEGEPDNDLGAPVAVL